jgi:hypothetical protein
MELKKKTVYNWNYTQQLLGYKAEEKLHLEVREQGRLNITSLVYTALISG